MNFSNYFLLIGIPLILGLWAQYRVTRAFSRYKKVSNSSGLTGSQVAQRILQAAAITDVEVLPIGSTLGGGLLGDHYDPTQKKLLLSADVYHGSSIAATGVAAHECGHALQHQQAYWPLNLRMAIVPATQLASNMLPFVILGGFFFHMMHLITLGIACYAMLMLFQLITLPVEFDASSRAKVILTQLGITKTEEEQGGVKAVLDAAALTYVAAFVATIGNLLYLLMIRNQNR